jgi:hypothetical protein
MSAVIYDLYKDFHHSLLVLDEQRVIINPSDNYSVLTVSTTLSMVKPKCSSNTLPGAD